LTKPGSSQFAFILVLPGRATRTILWSRGSAAELAPEEIPPGLVEGARLLHLDGLMAQASLAAARQARAARVPVVLDMGTLRPQFEPLARLTDHLLVSEPLATAFAPGAGLEEALARLHGLGPAVAAVTLGSRGCLAFDGRAYHRQPAFDVPVQDTTGAGDAFHGGYIAGLLDGLPLPGRLRLAAAVAALACAALGGRTGLPDRTRLEEFLEGR
jgi:ribokinase